MASYCVIVCVLFIAVAFSTSSVVRAEASRASASGQVVLMPVVTISPSPAVIFQGQSVEFNCTHNGNVDANITWLRNGESLSGVTTESFLMGGSVVLEAIPRSWNGSRITCQISPTASAFTELIVLSRNATILTPPTNQSVREGQSFTLTCVTRGLPAPTVTWFKDGDIFHYNFLEGVDFSQGFLVFSRASDELAGVYECQAENSLGRVRSAPATVEVFFSPSFSQTPRSRRIENGSGLTLMCRARGHPPPSISWTQNGMNITSGGRVEILSSGDLFISTISTNDMGVYRCAASNELDTIYSDDAVVVVLVPPLFLMTPDPTSVDSGESVVLMCVAFGIPPPSYTWFHDGVQVEGGTRVHVNNGTLRIDSLRREDGGEYECRAENEAGVMTSSALLQVYAPPPPPRSLEVTQKGATWVEIRWMANPLTNPPVQSYNVEYRLSFELQRQQDNGTLNMRFNITGLYPSAQYLVQVRAESPKGVGEPSAEISVRTEPGVPGPELKGSPENVIVEPITSRSLTIRWTIPDVLLRTSYNLTRVVVMDPSGTRTPFNLEDSQLQVHSLQPVTTYRIEVAFLLTGGFMGPSFQTTATTLEAAPSDAPTITNVTSTGPNTIFLTWTPPSMPNGDIQSYTIRYAPTSRPSETPAVVVVMGNQSVWEVVGLRAFTNYSLELSANTSVGEGPANRVFIRTEEDVPSTAPANTSAIPLSPHSLQLSWQPLAEEDVPGELVKYALKYHQKHHGGHRTCVHIEPNRTVHVLHGLKPFTEYRAQVAGVTNAGTGPFSDMFFALTAGTVPSTVVRILSVTQECPSSLVVEWEEPGHGLNSSPDEVSYTVRYEKSDGSGHRSVEANGTNYTIEGLEPFTLYNISVAVKNSHGEGSFSEVVQSTTCEGVSSPPRNLTVHPVSSTALQLSWQPPEEIPGVLVNYSIMFIGGGSMNTSILPPDNLTYQISGLEPYTVYNVSIAAVTGGGASNFSSPEQGQTFTSRPTVPVRNLSITPECPSSLVVTWEEPDPSGLHSPPEDVKYIVKFRESGEPSTAMNRSAGSQTSYTLENLQRSTEYNVSVVVKNSNGTGPGAAVQQSTPPGVPSAPLNVQAIPPLSTHTLTITWSPPSPSSGIRHYNVRYIETSESSKSDIRDWMLNSTTADNVTLQGLAPFTNYSIHVSAQTECGEGNFSEPVLVESTEEDRSGPPARVRGVASLSSSVVVGWDPPTSPNGVITGYNVSCPGNATLLSPTSDLHECRGLQPRTPYNITVAALNSVGEGEGASVSITTACEASPQVDPSLTLTVDQQQSSCFSSSVLIIVQVVVGTREISSYSLDELLESTEEYAHTRQRRQDDSEQVYIAANVTVEDLHVGRGFQLGDGRTYGTFQNYELDPGVSYNVGLRSTVEGDDTPMFAVGTQSFVGPSLTDTTAPPTTTPPTTTIGTPFPLVPVVASAGAVAVLVLAILVVSIVICSCCCCNRSRTKTEDGQMERASSIRLSSRRKTVDPVDEFRANHRTEALEEHPPVPVNGFVNKLLVMRTNDNQLFLEEFGSIQMAPQFPNDTANLPYNQPKNRYNNILAYDHSRVRLNSIRGQQGSDYINASYCAGYMNQKAYIATQGPIPETVSDFWRMVWEENSRTIVMLTNTQERGKTKCETYWPRELGTSTMHGHLEVTLVNVIQLADYTIRTFTLRKGSSSKDAREVRQFHFTSWPDHGVPQYSTAMLAMINRVRAYHQQGAGPMVVHCSAGVGRSGTFIVIDSMLERMKHKDHNVDIYGHVSLLRAQRNYMVQTEDQYFFIYEAVAEAIVCGNTEVPMDQLPGYVRELCQVIPHDEQDTTFIELEFKRLVIDKNDPHRFATANRDANKSKNRYVNVLPYETNRVCLEYLRGVDGSDYINASHIDSYHTRRAFIMTQGPLNNTVVDFWRMVVQHNTPVIVMLTQLVEKGTERCVQYWPGEPLHSETYGGNTVEMAVERNSGPYTYRELHVTNDESGHRHLVRHFQFHGWPEVGVPGTPLILMEFIREIQKLHITLNTKAPIVVHCSNGIGRSGVFVALHNIIERMQAEGLVDVFQTVKNLRIQRPAAVQTLEQYQFCYDAAVDFLQSSDMLLHFRQRSTGSSVSLRSRKSRTSSPSRNDSSLKPTGNRSSRNFELNRNSGSHIYGGSDATSTFGTQRTNSSPFSGSLNGCSGSQLLPQNGPDQRYSGASNFSSHSGEA